MDTNYKQPIESFNTHNKNQTTLLKCAPAKQCGAAPQPGRPQQVNSSRKGPARIEIAAKVLTINIVGWLFSRLAWKSSSLSAQSKN